MSESSPQIAGGPRLERLGARDLRVLLIWIFAGLLGAGVAWRYFFQAFPEASVNFQISRDEALSRGRQFISNQKIQLEGYESTIVFSVDDNTKTYLERTVGLERANELMSHGINTWHWEIRFFRPQQKEEFSTQVSPEGQIVGYGHIIEEARKGEHLERDAARTVAEQFLHDQYRPDLTGYDFLPEEANSSERPNRRDWSFTWQLRGFHAPDGADGAPYRLRVTLHGDEVGSAEEYLKIPDSWTRDYARIRSANDFLVQLAVLPYLSLFGAAFWIIYELSRRNQLHWSSALKLGLFFTVLWLALSMNNWSSTRAAYETDASYSAFVFEQVAAAIGLAILQAALVTIAFAPGEPLYRASQPQRLRLIAVLKLPALRSKEFFNSCVIGLSFAAAHIGYVVIFYLVGGHFGVWAPQDINFDPSTSSLLPWLGAMTIGLYAAASEEFFFRMFAIPFFQRITKSKIIAVVLPAFMWSFLHSNYPQEPAYIRGIEIGLIGIVAGLVMLRWGILTTLIWHYTVDATLGSLLLMRSASPYLRVSGAIVSAAAVIPLLYCAVMYWKHGGFEVREDLLNSAEQLTKSEIAEDSMGALPTSGASAVSHSAVYNAMPPRATWTLVLCGVAGIAMIATTHSSAIGDYLRVSMDAHQAATKADSELRARRVDVARFHSAVVFISNFDPLVNEFLRRKVGIAGANQIYEYQVPQAFWRVRYFRDSEKEEYAVLFRADGELHSIWHTLEESAPGATLTKEEALARAEAWLRENKHIDFASWRLVDPKSEAKPKRTDHLFVWEQSTPLAGGPNAQDAAFKRIELQVQGDELSTFRTYIKLPEEWIRSQQKQTLPKIIQMTLYWVLVGALAVIMLVIYFRNLKSHAAATVPWKRLSLWGLWGLVAILVSEITNLPVTLHSYLTQVPLKIFYATLGIGFALGPVILFACIAFLFGLAHFFWTQAARGDELPRWLGMPATYYRDALLVATAGSAGYAGFEKLLSLVTRVWPTLHERLTAAIPTGFDSLSPAAQAVASSVYDSLLSAAGIAVLSGFIAVRMKPLWLRLSLWVVATIAMMNGWGSPGDFAQQFLIHAATILVFWWGVTKIVRFNLLGYFLLMATLMLFGEGTALLRQPNSYLHHNGVMVLSALLLLLLWPLVAWRRALNSRSLSSDIQL